MINATDMIPTNTICLKVNLFSGSFGSKGLIIIKHPFLDGCLDI